MPLTFKDIYQDIIHRFGQDISDKDLVGDVKNWVNQRYKKICSKQLWPFMQDSGQIITSAEYTTGTIGATNASTTVTGTSSVWTKAMTGRKFKTDAFDEIYKIYLWSSATSITLYQSFNGDTETSGTYTIFQDEYLCDENWQDIINIRQFRSPAKLEKISLNEFRRLYPNNEPMNADPEVYCYYETRDMTRINIDEVTGTFVNDEIVNGGTSSAYGIIKKVDDFYLYIQVLYGTFSDNETITGATSAATASVNEPDGYVEGNLGGVLNIMLYPAPYRAVKLECDFIKKTYDMVANDDEPLIPDRYRDCIIYGACGDMAAYLNRLESVSFYEGMFRERIKEMSGDLLSKTLQFPRIISMQKRKRYGTFDDRLILDRADYE